jgi:hypothetical protein
MSARQIGGSNIDIRSEIGRARIGDRRRANVSFRNSSPVESIATLIRPAALAAAVALDMRSENVKNRDQVEIAGKSMLHTMGSANLKWQSKC